MRQLCASHPDADAVALEAALTNAYATPPRAYHNLGHVEEVCFNYRHLVAESDPLVLWAILFHDAVYEAGRSDNEERSAELAMAHLGFLSHPDADRVRQLILATAYPDKQPQVAGGAAMVDADLLILAREPEGYEAYRQGIRQEYRSFNDDQWREGRSAFLNSMLSRPNIFWTSLARHREEEARRNMRAELITLEMGR